jgi:MipA family protein
MTRSRRYALANLLLSVGATALAAEQAAEPPDNAPKPTSESSASGTWEGAIGPFFVLSPAYSGASYHKLSVRPGLYLRRGRFSFGTGGGGGFYTRRADDVFQGLGLDLVDNDRVHVNFGLRLDRGRRAATRVLAAGEGVRQTVRLRGSVIWELGEGWKLAADWNPDLLGHGGGNVVNFGAGHDMRIGPRVTWSVGAGSTWADGRYMRSYYGVTSTASLASGYPMYTPGSGVRDVSLSTGFRMEIDSRWTALWGASVRNLLGPAADSPFTASARQWSLNAGIGWQF